MTQCLFAEDIKLDKISYQTFYGCRNLEKIAIPSSVTAIELQAFYRCESLEKICIPENIISIGDCAFDGCSNLKEVKFEKESKLETIGGNAFGVVQLEASESRQG